MPPQDTFPNPTRAIPSDAPGDSAKPGVALCLSGGGYRAMLFHVGSLWRLNEAGYLPKIDRISCVSGGSITGGVLGLNWDKLGFDDEGVAAAFDEQVVKPIRAFASTTTDARAIFGGFLFPLWISSNVAKIYRRRLFGDATLQDLPDKPRLVINSTNVQSGVLWRFSKPYMWDYRVGKIENPTLSLATAVAASSAFPPLLSPVVLNFAPEDYAADTGMDLQRPPFTTKVTLTDGGVYDNLGLETAWKRYKTVLVSDAGGKMADDPSPKRNWLSHTIRVLMVIDNQVRSLRKRQLISSYKRQGDGSRDGAYWGIRAKIGNYKLDDTLPSPPEKTRKLADVATRLKSLDAPLQKQLINWGYAITDAAFRKHVDSSIEAPSGFPYPAEGVG